MSRKNIIVIIVQSIIAVAVFVLLEFYNEAIIKFVNSHLGLIYAVAILLFIVDVFLFIGFGPDIKEDDYSFKARYYDKRD